MEGTNSKPSIKVVLLGNSGAGKSSLAQRFVFNKFNHYSESTIGASFFTKKMIVNTNHEQEGSERDKASQQESNPYSIKFQVWDTAGQEKYNSLAPMVRTSDYCDRPQILQHAYPSI